MAFAKLHHRYNSKGERIYYVEYRLPGRKNTKFTIGNVQARKAKEIGDKIRALIVQGIDPHEFVKEQSKYSKEKPRLKLSELIEAYMKYCSKRNRPRTIKRNQDGFNKLREYTGDCYVDTIDRGKIESWMENVNVSKTTVNIHLRSIQAMFNWGFKRELITVNPFANAGIKFFKVSDSDPEDYFTLDEVKLILETLKNENEMMWRIVFMALELVDG